jgi:hypothetical protein
LDDRTRAITSATREIRLDPGAQVVTVDTPRAQGAAGFLGRKGKVSLTDVEIEMKNDYGTVLVVALDDQPLATSKKILVQCMTIDQLFGWETSEPGGLRGTIRSLGSAPWGVQRIRASVTLRRARGPAFEVVACDENGYPTDQKTRTTRTGHALTIEIHETTVYTVVRRR